MQNAVFRGKISKQHLFSRTYQNEVVIISRLHIIFGAVIFVVFLATGGWMRVDFPDKEIIEPEYRMLMRSRHIYILFSSLLHIVLGLYLQISPARWRKTLQIIGSSLLTLGSILLVQAFFFEVYRTKSFSDISRFGLYASLTGAIAHFIGNLGAKNPS